MAPLETPSLSSQSTTGGGASAVAVELLEERRLLCEKEGNYEEAEALALRAEEFRRQEELQKRKEIESQQMVERLGVEEVHTKELHEFNEVWERRCAEFEAHAALLQGTLSQRQQSDLRAHLERARAETEPRAPRHSKELLNLRKIQDTLAKMKKYIEAAATKVSADEMEEKENAAWKAKREAKIQASEEKFVQKQQLEMRGLLKRIQSSREEYTKARKTELEQVLQRHLNARSQLESQHKLNLQKVFLLRRANGCSVDRPAAASEKGAVGGQHPRLGTPRPGRFGG